MSRVAVRKAKEATDIGSLKLQIADENRKLSKIYENLGREYYDRFQDEAAEELSGLVKQIKDSTDKIAALQDEISRVEAESAARAEEERVRREAEAQARRESVAEAEMREVDEDEGYEEYEDEEAKKNGEMTGYEEETTGEEAVEYTDETEDEADTAYTEGSERKGERLTLHTQRKQKKRQRKKLWQKRAKLMRLQSLLRRKDPGMPRRKNRAEFRVVINQNRACIQKPEWLSGTFRFFVNGI